ncbi:hypothetical protein DsansV1_C23g0178851 [Dioscorea sansibarensis]
MRGTVTTVRRKVEYAITTVLLTPISVTDRQQEHLTDGAPYGYISRTSHAPHFTLPT